MKKLSDRQLEAIFGGKNHRSPGFRKRNGEDLEEGIEGEAADFLGDFFNHREIRQLLDIEGNVKRAAKDIGEGLARVIKFQTFGRIDLTNNG